MTIFLNSNGGGETQPTSHLAGRHGVFSELRFMFTIGNILLSNREHIATRTASRPQLTWTVVGLFCAFAAGIGAVHAQTSGVPLQPPLPPSADVNFEPPDCRSADIGSVSGAHLVVANGTRLIGPYAVPLNSIVNPNSPPDDGYRPILIEADAGTTLRIDLDNKLPKPETTAPLANTVNLHTHGLIVSPTPFDDAHPCPGDSIFQIVEPYLVTGSATTSRRQYKIPIPRAAIPAAFFGLPGGKLDHPSGLYWFHVHVHGVAREQVTSGMSGLLSIGDPMTHLRIDRMINNVSHEDETATRLLRSQTDVVTMALRDIQIDVPTCDAATAGCDQNAVLPGGSAPVPRPAGVAAKYDTTLCDKQTAGGFCAVVQTADAGPGGKPFQRVWLFTVNGQLVPTIDQLANRNQLWRLANTSASVAYVLDVVDASAPDTEQPLCVVSLDGVVAGTAGGTARSCDDANAPVSNYGNVGLRMNRVLMMPGSRVEIFRPYPATGGTSPARLLLRSVGLKAGNSNPKNSGDHWPAIDLAMITVQPRPDQTAPRPVLLKANLVRTQAPASGIEPAVHGAARPRPAHRPVVSASELVALSRSHPGCVFLPADDDHRRQIVFDENEGDSDTGGSIFNPKAAYGQGAFALGIRDIDGPLGTNDDNPNLGIPPAPYQMAGMSEHSGMHAGAAMNRLPTGHRACSVLGRGEVWELTNWTTEVHNFHIHQGKFRLARTGDPGLPRDLKSVVIGEDPTGSEVMNYLAAVADPTGEVQAWHDTIPVPPRIEAASGKAKPGRLFIYIPFLADQQIGSFVFHCHILEHEDKGMMANIEVVRPLHTENGRSVSR